MDMNVDCLFCRIVKGEVPCYKIYEDEKFLAFLDAFPLTPGHTLVIPKQHFRWVWDVEPAGEYFEVIKKVANQFRKVLSEDFLPSVTLGEAVPHAHYHLLPGSGILDKWLNRYAELKKRKMMVKEEGIKIVEKLGMAG
jgi:histidine triad (HIT) family protein